MGGEKRRENLLKILQESESAVSGTKLATKFQVSRQVIVQWDYRKYSGNNNFR